MRPKRSSETNHRVSWHAFECTTVKLNPLLYNFCCDDRVTLPLFQIDSKIFGFISTCDYDVVCIELGPNLYCNADDPNANSSVKFSFLLITRIFADRQNKFAAFFFVLSNWFIETSQWEFRGIDIYISWGALYIRHFVCDMWNGSTLESFVWRMQWNRWPVWVVSIPNWHSTNATANFEFYTATNWDHLFWKCGLWSKHIWIGKLNKRLFC